MSDNHHHNTHVYVFDQSLLLGSIYALKTTGSDSHCGCPGCHGGTVHCAVNKQFLPNELEGKISKQEFLSLSTEIDNIFNFYHWPVFPCFFTFCTVCTMLYCTGERVSNISRALDRANERISERGFYWEMIGGNGMQFGYIALLKVNDAAHAKYLANHPQMASVANSDPNVITAVVVESAPTEATAEMVMVRDKQEYRSI